MTRQARPSGWTKTAILSSRGNATSAPATGGAFFAQRYNNGGSPQGSEFLVNSYTTGDQTRPAVAMTKDGAFTVAWQSQNQDGSGWGIYGQSYDKNGVSQALRFKLHDDCRRSVGPSIAMDDMCDLVVRVEWQRPGR